MPAKTLTCDQAIFTSVRTPMGEGYRIIAASKSIRAEEKQTITRFSPSHEGICLDAHLPSSPAMAFYPLPSARLCVAISFAAGAEHTGRGGKRVYTHLVVIDESQFASIAYNPFHIVRAMIRAELNAPQLKPPPVIPPVELTITEEPASQPFPPFIDTSVRCAALEGVLTGRSQVIAVEDHWTSITENLLMGLPGPMRANVSVAAGLRFSAARCHRINLLRDHRGDLKMRLTGQRVNLIQPGEEGDQAHVAPSEWTRFVERHWSDDKARNISSRTSAFYSDTSPQELDYAARLFNFVDTMENLATVDLLEQCRCCLIPNNDTESQARNEFNERSSALLAQRLSACDDEHAKVLWNRLVELWMLSTNGANIAVPAIRTLLNRSAKTEPIDALTFVLQLAETGNLADSELERTVSSLLLDLANRVRQNKSDDAWRRLTTILEALIECRPDCSAVAELQSALTESAAPIAK